MSDRPRLLDLFCGAGGCAVGYQRAGFHVVGVDNRPQKNFPFEFVQGDALEFLAAHGHEFDAIHASPPCQAFSSGSFLRGSQHNHPDLLTPTLAALRATVRPWIVENVPGSPQPRGSILLCGLSFGLKLFRHRIFSSSNILFEPPHIRHGARRIGRDGMVCLAGKGQVNRSPNTPPTAPDHCTKKAWTTASSIDWMTKQEMAQAIPPQYTEFLGRQLIRILK